MLRLQISCTSLKKCGDGSIGIRSMLRSSSYSFIIENVKFEDILTKILEYVKGKAAQELMSCKFTARIYPSFFFGDFIHQISLFCSVVMVVHHSSVLTNNMSVWE